LKRANQNKNHPVQNNLKKHPMSFEAQLAWKCPLTPTFIRQAIWTRISVPTDLVYGMWSGFICRSVHARQHPDRHPHTHTHTHTYI